MVTVLVEADAVVEADAIGYGKSVLIEDGRVTRVGYFDAPAAARKLRVSGTLLPGLVDLQVNGMGGRACDEAGGDALLAVAQACARGGAAAFLPTLITAPFETLLRRTSELAQQILAFAGPGAIPLGLHLEGPFLEASGVHDESCFVDPTPARIAALLAAARGTWKLVTLAPARKGAPEAIAMLRAHGVQVAIGHATSTEHFAAAVAAGAGMVTHLFNAMGPIHHRNPGIAGLALDEAKLMASLIVDGAHVHPAMVRNAFACLGVDRTILVTDAVAAAGMPDGDYDLSGLRVRATDGVVKDAQGRLAGSALTMAKAVRNFATFVPDAGPWTLARVAATNPARAIGMERHFGAIAVGARARFALLAPSGELAAFDPDQ